MSSNDDFHYYEPDKGHGLPHDPFNAMVGPRPIGWISSQDENGALNLAPYSFFNAFNYTPRAVLNISRDSMASYGFSPATRLFEAAGAGACLLTDAWEGIEMFLEPDTEVLVVDSGDDVLERLRTLDVREARRIGAAARRRVLSEHTYDRRAAELDALLGAHAAA